MPNPGVMMAGIIPYLEMDDFYDNLPLLTAAGWTITEIVRYDPTRLAGLTPSGKAFSVDMVDGVITVTIAGNARTINRAKTAWLDGPGTRQALLDARAAFPANQR